jgi:hypothetical protein
LLLRLADRVVAKGSGAHRLVELAALLGQSGGGAFEFRKTRCKQLS